MPLSAAAPDGGEASTTLIGIGREGCDELLVYTEKNVLLKSLKLKYSSRAALSHHHRLRASSAVRFKRGCFDNPRPVKPRLWL